MKNVLSWVLQIVAAIILLQTLFFKFTGAEESIYIFSKVGLEPAGRYATGIFELIAGIMLLTPKWNWVGALLGIGLMIGAIFFHLTTLGIEVQGDGGYLFYLGLTVLFCSAGVLVINFNKGLAFARSLTS